MLALGFWEVTLATIFFIVCALLILLVLLQKGRGGGLGAAFGGAGSSAFGTRTGDVFTWVTIVLVAMFLLLAIVSSVAFRPPPQWVAQPRFEPGPPGDIGVPNNVNITCETKGTLIYYTIDGPEPDEDSIPYTDGVSVPVQPGQTLRARAFRKNWDPSPVTVATYGVEPPELPLDVLPIDEDAAPEESTDVPPVDEVGGEGDGEAEESAEESTPAGPVE